MSPTFGFCIIGTVLLSTSRTMIGVVFTCMTTLIVVRFEATGTKITSTKEARQGGNDIVMVVVIQQHKLLALGWSEGGDGVTSCGINQ